MNIEILMFRGMDSIKKNTSDPSEIRAKKISRGRQDLQDHLDRGTFGLRAARRSQKKSRYSGSPGK
jgi:hypothetical protein